MDRALPTNHGTLRRQRLWKQEEVETLDDAIRQYGTQSWADISRLVKTKTPKQCRSKFQKERDRKAKIMEASYTGPTYNPPRPLQVISRQYTVQNQNTHVQEEQPPKAYDREVEKPVKASSTKIEENGENERTEFILKCDPGYKCEQCSIHFPNKDTIIRHINIDHLHKPYDWPCEYCGRKFSVKKSLYNHVKKRHEELERHCNLYPPLAMYEVSRLMPNVKFEIEQNLQLTDILLDPSSLPSKRPRSDEMRNSETTRIVLPLLKKFKSFD